ncbi:hypothetical protein [Wolbachia endosymbiont (group B) of Myelois circumvoluta]
MLHTRIYRCDRTPSYEESCSSPPSYEESCHSSLGYIQPSNPIQQNQLL